MMVKTGKGTFVPDESIVRNKKREGYISFSDFIARESRHIDMMKNGSRVNNTNSVLKTLYTSKFMELSTIDFQQYASRYRWYNLPIGLTKDKVELVLYKAGAGGFFYSPITEKYYFLPVVFLGDPDPLGYRNIASPRSLLGSSNDSKLDKKKATDKNRSLFPEYDREFVVRREVLSEMEEAILMDEEYAKNSIIIMQDHLETAPDYCTPRQVSIQDILKMEAEQFVLARTSAILASGATGIGVDDSEMANQVDSLNDKIFNSLMEGKPIIPISKTVGKTIDKLDLSPFMKPQEFLQNYQAIDNTRLESMGITNGGAFQKQGTILQSEMDMSSSRAIAILLDGLRQRQQACNIFNQIFNLDENHRVWCTINTDADIFNTDRSMYGRSYENDYGAEYSNAMANSGGIQNDSQNNSEH